MAIANPAAAGQDRAAEAQQPTIQARPGGPESTPRTDQTVDVAKGTRLVLSNNAGEVVVRSWDRDQVRVQAMHNERVAVDVSSADATLRVRARASRGPSGLVDFQLTVPRWMAVNLSGTYLESTIEGTTAEVTVESVNGNIRVNGGSGNVTARSVQGMITIDKAAGNVRATTVNEDIMLTDVSGDVYAETTNGDIDIANAQTTSLEVSTVNGDVTFNGSMRDSGAYRITTHGGDIRVGLGGVANATVFVRTFQGDFASDFAIQLPEGQSARSGSKRFNFTLGSGAARVELQTFNGDITIARKAIPTPSQLRRQRRDSGGPSMAPQPPQPPQLPAPAPKPKPPGDWAHVAPHVAEHLGAAVAPRVVEMDGAWREHILEPHQLDGFDFDFEFDFHFDEMFVEIPEPPAPAARHPPA